MTNNEGQFHYFYIPLILFIYLAVFSIAGYIFEINLGNDDYQTWNIGFNPSDLDYLKGRMNGFQAGGPNSFADLITITAVYSLFKYKNSYALFIVPLALIAVIVTYSRFSLIVLILFIFIKFIKDRLYAQLLVSVLVLSIAVIQLGVYERFVNDDNNGISDRLLMLEASTEYFISSSLEKKLIGNGSNQLIFESNNIYLYDEFEKNPYSYGPHNSFIFYLINYGIVGIVLYILIFLKLFKRKLVFEFNLTTLAVFSILSLSTDLLHNHSVSWFLYFVYFSHIKSEK
jgi:O-antigen ligase